MQAAITPVDRSILIGDQMFEGVFERSTDFTIEMELGAAFQFLRRIDRYNDFHGETVIEALHHIDRLIPRSYYSHNHPANDQVRYRLRVGREGSPVIYLTIYDSGDLQQVTDGTLQRICLEMELTGRADEAEYKITPLPIGGSRRIEFRFWWD